MPIYGQNGTGVLGNYSQGGAGLGVLGGAQQQTPDWANKLGLISAALKDAANSVRGQGDTNSMATWQQGQQQNQIRQQLMAGMQSADPAIQKQAAMYALASGIDPTPWLNLNRPKVEHVGDDLVSVDPFDPTKISTVRAGVPAAPSGYSRSEDGKSLSFIPGGPGDPTQAAALAGGRREPPPGYIPSVDGKGLTFIPGGPADPQFASRLAGARRAPPKASATGAINLPHPGSLY